MARRGLQLAALVVLIAAFALLPAATAPAQSCKPANQVPPGNSEVDQYVESLPGACGNERPGGGGDGGGGSGGGAGSGSAIPASTESELQSFGEAGQAAAALANATAPRGVASDARRGRDDGAGAGPGAGGDGGGGLSPADVAAATEGADGSLLGALVDAFSGGSESGTGVGLPLLLLAILIGGAGFYYFRGRRA